MALKDADIVKALEFLANDDPESIERLEELYNSACGVLRARVSSVSCRTVVRAGSHSNPDVVVVVVDRTRSTSAAPAQQAAPV